MSFKGYATKRRLKLEFYSPTINAAINVESSIQFKQVRSSDYNFRVEFHFQIIMCCRTLLRT